MGEAGAYIVTAATYRKEHLFEGHARLKLLEDNLLGLLSERHFNVQAWAVFPNHYHVVLVAEDNVLDLRSAIRDLHSATARQLNAEDDRLGRKVWFQYWDTHLTSQQSYFARLKYVHTNAVKHGLVSVARDYPYCSARWFEEVAEPSFVRTIESFSIGRVLVPDHF